MRPEEASCARRDGRSLAYRVHGHGPPLICLPNPYMSARTYFGDLDALASVARVVLVDPRGTGRSDPADSYTMADHVADVESIRDALGFETTAVLGHSAGALVALAWAVEHVDRATRVFMVSGALRPMTDPEALPAAVQMMQERHDAEEFQAGIEALLGLNQASTLEPAEAAALRFTAFWPFLENHDEASAHALRRLAAGLPNLSSQQQFETERADGFAFRARLGTSPLPVTVVTGEFDPTTVGTRYAKETADQIPGAELVVVPGAGHGVWFEAPDAFRAVIAERLC